jgi:hypothetical protein
LLKNSDNDANTDGLEISRCAALASSVSQPARCIPDQILLV